MGSEKSLGTKLIYCTALRENNLVRGVCSVLYMHYDKQRIPQ